VKCSRRRAALLYLPRSNTREPPVEPPGAQTTDAYTREMAGRDKDIVAFVKTPLRNKVIRPKNMCLGNLAQHTP
jgi:hypothetical protein